MQAHLKKYALISGGLLALVSASALTAGCEQNDVESAADDAADTIEDAADETKDTVEDAVDEVDDATGG